MDILGRKIADTALEIKRLLGKEEADLFLVHNIERYGLNLDTMIAMRRYYKEVEKTL